MICNVVRPVEVWGPCFPLPSTQLAVGLGSPELLSIAKLPWRGPTTCGDNSDAGRISPEQRSLKGGANLNERDSYIHTYKKAKFKGRHCPKIIIFKIGFAS